MHIGNKKIDNNDKEDILNELNGKTQYSAEEVEQIQKTLKLAQQNVNFISKKK